MTSSARLALFIALCVGSSNALTPFGLRIAYKGLLKSYPTLTHVAQGAGVVGTGDWASQLYVNRKNGQGVVDGGRVARTCWTGMLWNGILLPNYYVMVQVSCLHPPHHAFHLHLSRWRPPTNFPRLHPPCLCTLKADDG